LHAVDYLLNRRAGRKSRHTADPEAPPRPAALARNSPARQFPELTSDNVQDLPNLQEKPAIAGFLHDHGPAWGGGAPSMRMMNWPREATVRFSKDPLVNIQPAHAP
jgi:hypothetical protein